MRWERPQLGSEPMPPHPPPEKEFLGGGGGQGGVSLPWASRQEGVECKTRKGQVPLSVVSGLGTWVGEEAGWGTSSAPTSEFGVSFSQIQTARWGLMSPSCLGDLAHALHLFSGWTWEPLRGYQGG